MILLKIKYSSQKLENICTDAKKASKYFGGNQLLVVALLSKINALKNAETLKDIIALPTMHFHSLKNKGKRNNLLGFYAIDIKGRTEPWRLILQPLNEDETPNLSKQIEDIKMTKIIFVEEASKHYG